MKTFFIHTVIAFIAAYIIMKNELVPLPYNAIYSVAVFLVFFIAFWLTALLYHRNYFRKLPKAVAFFFFFLKELIKANLKIAYDIVTPNYQLRPAIIALPLTVQTDREITLLAILITLTPGTLSLDVSEDKKILYVHALYANHDNLDEMKDVLKHGFERRLMELTL
ncbi:MAG TPA: Na+/H+ antiporter subunit E [Adhaeribacter sp.]|nr:Na+/H+ antiporter subunit E [Adhaeribacter sp.]